MTVPADDKDRVTDEEQVDRIRALTRDLPADTELRRILLNIEDPVIDEASRDRYTAIVGAGAVEEGLKVAHARRLGIEASDKRFVKGGLRHFADRVREARRLDLLTAEEAIEVDRIQEVRNAFAHALTTISFDTSFAPAFPPRRHFAIVCGEFYRDLVREQPDVVAEALAERAEGNAGG